VIRRLPYANIIAGFLLMISGLLRFRWPLHDVAPLVLLALWYLLPALIIQLLQGGARPFLGWLGIILILGYIAGYALISPNAGSGAWDPFAGGSPVVLILFLLWVLAPTAAFVLVGISMIRAGHFPRFWGYALALTALPLLLQGGYAFTLPSAFVLLLLGIREIIHKRPTAPALSQG
jgi:hypothetical protein